MNKQMPDGTPKFALLQKSSNTMERSYVFLLIMFVSLTIPFLLLSGRNKVEIHAHNKIQKSTAPRSVDLHEI
jgi:hypothetical protein